MYGGLSSVMLVFDLIADCFFLFAVYWNWCLRNSVDLFLGLVLS